MNDLAIAGIEALPCSVPLREGVTQGLGRVVKRDTVVVKITTEGGLTGFGECYNGRAPLAIAQTVATTLRYLLTGMNAAETAAIWETFERRVLANHGTCAACVCAMSGVDMALWDIRGKAAALPLYRLLGGSARPVPAYAGGFALGYADPPALADEARACVWAGYQALKLRLGDTLARDLERAAAMRAAVGDGIALLADANCRYSVGDVAGKPGPRRRGRRAIPPCAPSHRGPGLALASAPGIGCNQALNQPEWRAMDCKAH